MILLAACLLAAWRSGATVVARGTFGGGFGWFQLVASRQQLAVVAASHVAVREPNSGKKAHWVVPVGIHYQRKHPWILTLWKGTWWACYPNGCGCCIGQAFILWLSAVSSYTHVPPLQHIVGHACCSCRSCHTRHQGTAGSCCTRKLHRPLVGSQKLLNHAMLLCKKAVDTDYSACKRGMHAKCFACLAIRSWIFKIHNTSCVGSVHCMAQFPPFLANHSLCPDYMPVKLPGVQPPPLHVVLSLPLPAAIPSRSSPPAEHYCCQQQPAWSL